ncbi:MAG: hypothetical protein CSA62_05410 [Planctomycetota bacterium]|nr:MAG: hypothetical protein CSA62_05410 [Planctomycetota bacterium]
MSAINVPVLPAAILSLALGLAAGVSAQKASTMLPEASLMQEVLGPALTRVSASVVTVETFGGYRVKKKDPAKTGPQARPQPKPSEQKKGGKKRPKLGSLKFPGFLQAQGVSTGLVVGSDGWILTSRWVLEVDPTTILVTLADGRKFTAERAGEDRTRGIAMLKIQAEGLPVPEYIAPASLRVGQWVLALGRSFGPKRPTTHLGILSAKGRISGRAVQSDANISPANYGGPLIDIEGRVIGINVPLSPKGDTAGADWYDSGIGFAATLADISEILAGMKAGKVYQRSLLGIRFSPADLGPGATLLSVQRGTAAHEARLRKGDKILVVDGVRVRHAAHLQDLIRAHVGGDWIELELARKSGDVVKVLIQLGSVDH